MNIATVLDSSDPVSMIRRQSGIISVVSRKCMTSEESFLTSAPITPRLVSLRYSKGRDFEVVFKNGYKNSGICAIKWYTISKISSEIGDFLKRSYR